MGLIHDIIKIKYVEEGYLPNYPYHMISDEEMCRAFMNESSADSDEGFFFDHYTVTDESLKEDYSKLVATIRYYIDDLIQTKEDQYELPNWIYSYMLGVVISDTSDERDIHDVLVLMDLDNVNDEFTEQAKKRCLAISKKWIQKIPSDQRYVSIKQANGTYKKYDARPATMFAEPHVIKSLRLQE